MVEEYEIIKNVIPSGAIENVLRTIHLDLAEKGISKRELEWWEGQSCWFPHLRFSDEVYEVEKHIPERFKSEYKCEPQILVSLPEVYDGELEFHTDEEPDWAGNKKYKSIVGIPLSPFNSRNGGIRLLTKEGMVIPQLSPTDLLVMNPTLAHSRGINRSGEIRYALYFRWVE